MGQNPLRRSHGTPADLSFGHPRPPTPQHRSHALLQAGMTAIQPADPPRVLPTSLRAAAACLTAAALAAAAGCTCSPDQPEPAPQSPDTPSATLAPKSPAPAPAQSALAAQPTQSAASNPQLRAALLEIRERDQAARLTLMELIQGQEPGPDGRIQMGPEALENVMAVRAIDAESTAFLEEMIAEHGWPTYDTVGQDGAAAAWLLAQHADAKPEFQARVLELMEPLVDQQQADPSHFALLTDRVLLAQGKKQRYGTQFGSDAQGVQRPRPVEDAARLDELRASVGLPPIADYARTIAEATGNRADPTPMDQDPAQPTRN